MLRQYSQTRPKRHLSPQQPTHRAQHTPRSRPPTAWCTAARPASKILRLSDLTALSLSVFISFWQCLASRRLRKAAPERSIQADKSRAHWELWPPSRDDTGLVLVDLSVGMSKPLSDRCVRKYRENRWCHKYLLFLFCLTTMFLFICNPSLLKHVICRSSLKLKISCSTHLTNSSKTYPS